MQAMKTQSRAHYLNEYTHNIDTYAHVHTYMYTWHLPLFKPTSEIQPK